MLRDLFAVLFIFLLAVLNGDFLFRRLKVVPGRLVSKLIHKYAVGIIAYVVVFQTLGILGLLYPNVIIGFLVVNFSLHISICLRETDRKLTSLREFFNKWSTNKLQNAFGVIQIAIAAYIPFLKANNAIFGYDSLAYHVYSPYRALHITHSFNSSDLIPNAGISPGTNSVFGLLSVFGSPQSSMYFQFFTYLILVIAGYQILRELKTSQRFLIFSTIVILLLTLGPTTISSPGTDLQVALFLVVIADYFLVIRTLNVFSVSEILCGSLIIGFLPVIKLLSAPIAITLFLYLVFKSRRICKGWNFQTVTLAFVCFSIIPISWHIKNWFDSGNPFFPAFRKYLGGLGYVKGIRTEEDDFRQTFFQSAQTLKSCNPSRFISTCGGGMQLLLYAGVTVVVVFSLFFTARRNGRNQVATYICVSVLGTIPILGIMPRYFVGPLIFLVIWQALTFNDRIHGDDLFGSGWKKRVFCITSSAVLLVSVQFLSLTSGWNYVWTHEDDLGVDRYWSYSGQSDLDALIAHLSFNENFSSDKFCMVGDGRAMLFWPLDVRVIPRDARNPLEQSDVKSGVMVADGFRSLGCDFVIYTSQWDQSRAEQPTDLALIGLTQNIVFQNESFKLINVDM